MPFILYSLNVTMYVLMFILNLFPIAWIVARLGGGLDRLGEPLNMFCNFAAKVDWCGGQAVGGGKAYVRVHCLIPTLQLPFV